MYKMYAQQMCSPHIGEKQIRPRALKARILNETFRELESNHLPKLVLFGKSGTTLFLF